MAIIKLMDERERLVRRLVEEGYLKSAHIIKAFKKVKRELFMAEKYKKYAYVDQPFPIPPYTAQTISAPHTYAIIYEALQLKKGDKFLEVGAGSGFGAALAREIVGKKGLVVTIEIVKETYEFAKSNLKKAGYEDVVVVNADGKLGYSKLAPYDKICVTAAAKDIPPALIEQLATNGKLVIPIGPDFTQKLVLLEKENGKIKKKTLTYVVYVPLV
jgi:protein-L-isoaspartate(D-aspartate) O-methyltransferase